MDRFLAQRAFGQRNQKELLLHRSVFQSRYAVQYRLPELLRRNFAAEFGRRIRDRIEFDFKKNQTQNTITGQVIVYVTDPINSLRQFSGVVSFTQPPTPYDVSLAQSSFNIPFGGGTQNIQKNELRASERSCGSLDPRHVGFVRRLFAVHDREPVYWH